jgi:hypothetical protein
VKVSDYMAPVFPCASRPNSPSRYTKPISKNSGAFGRGANLPHLIGREFRVSMLFSSLRGAVSNLVLAVSGLCAPREVISGIVVPGSVEMAHAFAFGARTVKRLAYEGRHPSMNPRSPGTKDEFPISVLIDPATQRPVCVDGSDLPQAGDFILWGFRDRSPFDHDSPPTCPTISYGGWHMPLHIEREVVWPGEGTQVRLFA